MIYYSGSPFFNATYDYNFTLKKYGWGSFKSDIYGEFLFGSQAPYTGSWFVNGTKYAIYIKKEKLQTLNISVLPGSTRGAIGNL